MKKFLLPTISILCCCSAFPESLVDFWGMPLGEVSYEDFDAELKLRGFINLIKIDTAAKYSGRCYGAMSDMVVGINESGRVERIRIRIFCDDDIEASVLSLEVSQDVLDFYTPTFTPYMVKGEDGAPAVILLNGPASVSVSTNNNLVLIDYADPQHPE